LTQWTCSQAAALLLACLLLAVRHAVTCQDLDFVELFAGCGMVSKQLRAAKFHGASIDILYNDGRCMDITTAAGFA